MVPIVEAEDRERKVKTLKGGNGLERKSDQW